MRRISTIIIIMYIYHALINALSAQPTHGQPSVKIWHDNYYFLKSIFSSCTSTLNPDTKTFTIAMNNNIANSGFCLVFVCLFVFIKKWKLITSV